jgi:hypothetical protein
MSQTEMIRSTVQRNWAYLLAPDLQIISERLHKQYLVSINRNEQHNFYNEVTYTLA